MEIYKFLTSLAIVCVFSFLIGMVSIITCAAIDLGHIPKYDVDPDPWAMGLQGICLTLLFVFMLSFYSLTAWFISFIILLIKDKGMNRLWNLHTKLLFSGIIVLLFIRVFMFSQFEWYFD